MFLLANIVFNVSNVMFPFINAGTFFSDSKTKMSGLLQWSFQMETFFSYSVSAVESSLHFFHTEINQTINKESEL